MITSPYNAILQTNGKVIHRYEQNAEVETNITGRLQTHRARKTERNCHFVVLDFGYTDCAHHITKQKASNQQHHATCLCHATSRAPNGWKQLYAIPFVFQPARSKCTKISTFVSKKRHIKTSLSRFTCFAVLPDTKPFVWMAVAQTSMTACFLLLLFQCPCVCVFVFSCICLRVTITQIKHQTKQHTRATRQVWNRIFLLEAAIKESNDKKT